MCDKCESKRILSVSAKCSDRCFTSYGDKEKDGYAPSGLNVGGGDYIEIDVCLDCGKVQGQFPVDQEAVDEIFPAEEEVVDEW